MVFRCLAFLLAGTSLLGSACAVLAGPEHKAQDEALLKSANVATDGPALMDFFKKRTVGEIDRERIKKLINEMGDDSFDVRQKANDLLLAMGPAARAQLREATQNADVEIEVRAKRALEQLEKEGGPPVVCAAARLLADRSPETAAEVLMNFLPSAEDQIVIDEISRALSVAGFRGGKPLAVLTDALSDKSPLRRAVAAEALCRGGGVAHRPEVRKMLRDPDATVRLRTALALYDVYEKESIPTLIALLVELPRDQAWRAEDVLYMAAGDKAPNGAMGHDDIARRDYRKLWEQWWKDNGEGLDLAKLEQKQRHQGFTLICQLDINKGASQGRVLELDAEGKIRWQFEGVRYPVDAQMIGEDRVLVTEYTGRQVTERNLKGEVLWTKAVNSLVLGARRLPNGNTFIVSRNSLQEVDKDGKEVVNITRPNDIAAGTRLRNGDYAIVTNVGQFMRLDKDGKELKSFPVGQVLAVGGNVEVLPNGHVLVPLYTQSKVVEYDAEGKQVWEAAVQLPSSVVRLPNGNILATSRNGRAIVELDRTGKEVAKTAVDGMPIKATRR
jgi:hypothetical protein